MAPRSLPERTVDAWAVAALCARFPCAILWAPSQRVEAGNWDLGAQFGDGKAFILENKASQPTVRTKSTPAESHSIKIDVGQLDWYCDEVEPSTGVPTFYLLPKPPWSGSPTGSPTLPKEAASRIASAEGPFEEWTYVVRSNALRAFLRPTVGQKSKELDVTRIPFDGCQTFRQFLDGVDHCDSAPEMRRFSGSPAEHSDTEATNRFSPPSRAGSLKSARAYFIPSTDLAVWPPPSP